MGEIALSMPLTLVLIFLLGFVGYSISKLFHIPGGAIIGSLVVLALVTSLGIGWAELPTKTSLLFQIIIGIVLGCKFSKEKVPAIKTLFLPGLFVAAWMICLSMAVAAILTKITALDMGTALYGSVPGGISEMSLIALSYDLKVPVVTLLQFVRVITVLIITPQIAAKYNPVRREEAAAQMIAGDHQTQTGKGRTGGILVTLAVGSVSGFTADLLGVPVGGMLGAMISVAALRIKGVKLQEIPKWLHILAQVGLGGYLGTTFTPDMVVTLKSLLLPTFLFSAVLVLSGLALGILTHRIWGWDLTTALLACAAAGYTQMSIIALDMDADVVTVSIVQALRAVIILTLMPLIIPLMI